MERSTKQESKDAPELHGGLTPSSFWNPMDLSPVLPQFYNGFFPTRECGGVVSDILPDSFKVTLNQQDITFNEPNGLAPMPLGVPGSIQTFQDECLALYDGVIGPVNEDTLLELVNQLAQDFFFFRSYSFDSMFIGICAFQPTALTDVIEFAYDDDVPDNRRNDQDGEIIELVEDISRPNFYTRIQSEPWTGYPDRFQHWDDVNFSGGCLGEHDRTPGIMMLAPGPADGKAMMTVLSLEIGRLKSTYDSALNLGPCCGKQICGCICITVVGCNGLPVPATVTVTRAGSGFNQVCPAVVSVTSITINNQGSGYTIPPTVTISGGGGTGATGTSVLGTGGSAGRVVSVTITDGGSGYISVPTVVFTGGGGINAAGTAVIASKACIQTDGNGVYTVLVSAPGFVTGGTTGTITGCGTSGGTISLVADSTHVCCPGCVFPIPKTLHLTGPDGTYTMTWAAGPPAHWETAVISKPATVALVPGGAPVGTYANGPHGICWCDPTSGGTTDWKYSLRCVAGTWAFTVLFNAIACPGSVTTGCVSPYTSAFVATGNTAIPGGRSIEFDTTLSCDQSTWTVTTDAGPGGTTGVANFPPMGFGTYTWTP